jgi:nucleotide-binding universal stress UspA family protein
MAEGLVVVGVDGSRQSLRALEWAAQDAALHRDRLKIVHVLPRYQYDIPFYPPGRWAAAETDGMEIVAEAVAIARECFPSLAVETQMPSAGVLAALRQESERARVVVVGARGWGGFHGLVLGSTSLHLAGHAASPVVVVRDVPGSAHHEIVVGVDGAEQAAPALEFAFEEAAAREARLLVVHAWQLPARRTEPPLLDEVNPEEVAQEQRRVLDEALAEWPDRFPAVKVVRALRREDHHPAHVLVEVSDRADLVVVGSRGRGGFHGLALGSVSHAVLHHALCPVAVARPRP